MLAATEETRRNVLLADADSVIEIRCIIFALLPCREVSRRINLGLTSFRIKHRLSRLLVWQVTFQIYLPTISILYHRFTNTASSDKDYKKGEREKAELCFEVLIYNRAIILFSFI